MNKITTPTGLKTKPPSGLPQVSAEESGSVNRAFHASQRGVARICRIGGGITLDRPTNRNSVVLQFRAFNAPAGCSNPRSLRR